jgi:hypothetical protein
MEGHARNEGHFAGKHPETAGHRLTGAELLPRIGSLMALAGQEGGRQAEKLNFSAPGNGVSANVQFSAMNAGSKMHPYP